MDYNLQKIYHQLNDVKSTKKTITDVYKEDVNVIFKPEGGRSIEYKLPDVYARGLMKKIKVETGTGIDEPINKIFNQGGWGNKQEAPKTVLKNIVINTDYEQSADLINYLAENKDKLLTLEELGVGNVINFVDAIIKKLPQNFRTNGLDEFIKQVHLSVTPGASTNVGLGEGTFSIFGTASKGRSGDLQWSGKEVEIKTNGTANSGAVLGGDGFMNKITGRMKFIGNYEPLNLSNLKVLEDALNVAKQAFDSKSNTAKAAFDKFKSTFNKNKLFQSEKLNNLIKSISMDDFFTKPITSDFTITNRPSKNSKTTYSAIVERINYDSEKARKAGTNLPSQISSLLPDDSNINQYVEVFTNLRTYENVNVNIKSQLSNFFKTHPPLDFNPRSNYKNFSNLVGSIALLCYKQHLGFDYITAGNDKKFTMVVIDCKDNSLDSIYNQVSNTPELEFDINIDVYEGGAFKSQTVFAKSPRIILK
jgi:hypothetical protein